MTWLSRACIYFSTGLLFHIALSMEGDRCGIPYDTQGRAPIASVLGSGLFWPLALFAIFESRDATCESTRSYWIIRQADRKNGIRNNKP